MPSLPTHSPNRRLRLARERHGWSQEELALHLGTTALAVYRWETGRTFPSPYYRQKLSALFAMSMEALGLLPPHPDAIATMPDADFRVITTRFFPVSPHQHLIGREDVVDDLRKRLLAVPKARGIALCGLPGVGKTALAATVAQDAAIQAHFPDGVLWAELGLTPNLMTVLYHWGHLLALAPEEMRQYTDPVTLGSFIQAAIGSRSLLFILDDAWQITTAHLLKVVGPNCMFLLTTRFPSIATQFAHEYVVTISELDEAAGMMLLSSLAPTIVAAYTEDARALVQSVGNLPLAITLIGHYLQRQSLSGQPRRVRHALAEMQTIQARMTLAEPRSPHEAPLSAAPLLSLSLQASIALSMQTLNMVARQLLSTLALFPAKPNSFSEDAAYAASGIGDVATFLDTLDMLLDAGLVESAAPERYRLHQTIADAARMNVAEKGSVRRIATYYAHFAEYHVDDLPLLAAEATNSIAAFDALVTAGLLPRDLLPGMTSFAAYLTLRGEFSTAQAYLTRAATTASTENWAREAAYACLELGWLAHRQDEVARSEVYAHESLTWGQQTQESQLLISIYHLLGSIHNRYGDYVAAQTYLTTGIAVAQAAGAADYHVLLLALGKAHLQQGKTTEAEQCYRDGLALAQAESKTTYVGRLLQALGVVAAQRGDFPKAHQYFAEALTIARRLGLLQDETVLLLNLGNLAHEVGDFVTAQGYIDEGLQLTRQYHFNERLCALLGTASQIALSRGDLLLASTYLQEGLPLARSLALPHKIVVMVLYCAQVALQVHEWQTAATYLREGFAISRQHQQKLLGKLLNEWGTVLVQKGYLLSALKVYHSALQRAREAELYEVQATILFHSAQARFALGDVVAAYADGQRSLRMFARIGHHGQHEVTQWLQTVTSTPRTEDEPELQIAPGGEMGR